MRILFILLLIVFVIMAFLGCDSTKHINRSVEKVDSTYTKELERKITELEITNANYKNVIRQLESIGVTYQDRCDTAALRRMLQGKGCPQVSIDSFIAVIIDQRNEIEILADGTKRFRGAIKSYSQTTQRLEETISDLKKTVARSEQEKESIKAELEATRKLKNKEVVKKVFPGFAYWLIPLALIAGAWLGWRFRKMQVRFDELGAYKNEITGI